jgi:hypothetical protein
MLVWCDWLFDASGVKTVEHVARAAPGSPRPPSLDPFASPTLQTIPLRVPMHLWASLVPSRNAFASSLRVAKRVYFWTVTWAP